MNKNILLLTATITPPQDAAQLQRVDPLLRLQDYATAFEFYLRKLKQGVISAIIFSDNSNSDVKILRDLAAQHHATSDVEFICYEGLDYPPSYGRGYGEFKMTDYVMANSQTIRDADEDSDIWKVTGRYVLENIEEVIRKKPKNIAFYCNCRNIPTYWVDLYVLSWSKLYYEQHIKGTYVDLKADSKHGGAEQAFRRNLESGVSAMAIAKRFKTVPLLQGYRGWDNKNYKDMGLKLFLRRAALVVAPWLWI